MKVKYNTEGRSVQAITITYSEYVSVALGIQPAMRMRHIVICGLPGPTVFFHINTLRTGDADLRF